MATLSSMGVREGDTRHGLTPSRSSNNITYISHINNRLCQHHPLYKPVYYVISWTGEPQSIRHSLNSTGTIRSEEKHRVLLKFNN